MKQEYDLVLGIDVSMLIDGFAYKISLNTNLVKRDDKYTLYYKKGLARFKYYFSVDKDKLTIDLILEFVKLAECEIKKIQI